jgi:hypothetical protein
VPQVPPEDRGEPLAARRATLASARPTAKLAVDASNKATATTLADIPNFSGRMNASVSAGVVGLYADPGYTGPGFYAAAAGCQGSPCCVNADLTTRVPHSAPEVQPGMTPPAVAPGDAAACRDYTVKDFREAGQAEPSSCGGRLRWG